jgi:hypothetical protein
METENQIAARFAQDTEALAPERNEARLPAQLAETEGIAHQNRFVLPNRVVTAYVRHDGRPWILPASFQWKGPSRGPRRPKKKPARPHYN